MRFGLVFGAIASLPLLAILISQWSRGWSPIGDEGVIALRSFDVFTTRMPLVGQPQLTSGGHQVFDPGPLQNWALAIPVRLFATGGGALLGTTIVEVGALIVGLVAVQRAAGRAAAAVVTAGALIAVWSAGPVLAQPVWNPYAALIPFVATALCGWAVATGSLRWWPVVVLFASFSMQTHLMYAPAAVAITVLVPLLGALTRRRIGSAVGKGWAVAGGIIGLICWSAPVLQELTHRPGNITLMWRNSFGSSTPGLGLTLALNHLARTVAPDPAWLHATSRSDTIPLLMVTLHGRAWWAIAALVALVAIVVAAAVRRDDRVLGLAAIALITDLAAIWVVTAFPHDRAFSLTYISWLFWPAGMLTWFAYGYTAVRWGRRGLAHFREIHPRGAQSSPGGPISRWSRTGLVGAASVLLVIAIPLSVFAGVVVDSWTPRNAFAWQSTGSAAQRIAGIITARDDLRHCRIRVGYTVNYALLSGINYQLLVRGRHPAPVVLAPQLKLYYQPQPGDPAIAVTDTLKDPVPPHRTTLGAVAVRDPDGTPHRYVISLTPATPASGSHHGAAC